MRLLTLICLAATAATIVAQQPHVETHGHATQIVVDGAPFLILGGELHNSSSSSAAYMAPLWPKLGTMHLNTVLMPIAWETIEPTEGHFDFTTPDALLKDARASHLHLVILWFGSWKNTYSSYAPAWVKTDTTRFPRVLTADGRGTERLSPFSPTARDADAHAFAALLHHLHETDLDHTVLMVQVENEVGVIPESRDHSPAAEASFAAPVPVDLTRYLEAHRSALQSDLRSAWETNGARTKGTWREVFGATPLTDDLFMAWHYAAYINRVAAAGKAEYPLPMYANAALIRPNYGPGQYNSGGPLPHSIDLWRAAAPALDFLSPDIYFNDFAHWAGQYAQPGNPLFIPEAQPGAPAAPNALYAFGALSAVGFSPFGIDDQANTPIDLAGIATKRDDLAIAHAYAVLAHLAPQILQAQQTGMISAALLEGEAQRSARITLGDYTATLTRTGGPATRIAAMFLQNSPSEFLVIASGDAQLTFSTDRPGPPQAGIESIDEEFFNNTSWHPGRRLNGDESSQGQTLKLYASDLAQGKIYKVRLYRYR